jgi:hypothetical protein
VPHLLLVVAAGALVLVVQHRLEVHHRPRMPRLGETHTHTQTHTHRETDTHREIYTHRETHTHTHTQYRIGQVH